MKLRNSTVTCKNCTVYTYLCTNAILANCFFFYIELNNELEISVDPLLPYVILLVASLSVQELLVDSGSDSHAEQNPSAASKARHADAVHKLNFHSFHLCVNIV